MIIGISGKFPKSSNKHTFYENLLNGEDMLTEKIDRFPMNNKNLQKKMGLMDDIETFDANFFGINNELADCLDPQIRMSLENSLECIMDAGIDPNDLNGRNVGVYSGSCFSDSMAAHLHDPQTINGREMVGNALCMIANRVSYYFNLKGPSYNFDSACSSSLVALTKAYEDLEKNIIEFAIVIGSSIILHPGACISFSKYSMLSPEGKSACYDKDANGYVRSEANIAILISQSKNYKDNYYGKIIGVGINSDGYTKSDIAYPSAISQKNLYETIYERYKIDRKKIHYIETHSTGTLIGDSEELKGLDLFFDEKILIGSVKSNIGHCEASSGLAGLVKILLSFKNGIIPKNINYNNPNDYLKSKREKFEVVTENKIIDWSDKLVGLNSFGFGGTNVHIVLENGKTNKGEKLYQQKFKGDLYRGVIGESALLIKKTIDNPKYCFLYTGMGSNYSGMGKGILSNSIGKEIIIKCHNYLKSLDNELDLLECYKTNIDINNNKIYPMVMLTSLQIALTEIIKDYGIEANNIIGYSIGELCAAYSDGCLTLEESIKISYIRGMIIEKLEENGKMVAVNLCIEEIKEIYNKLFGKNYANKISVACDNSPTSCTISGFKPEIEKVTEYLDNLKIDYQNVNTYGIAYHSPQLNNVRKYAEELFLNYIPDIDKNRSHRWLSTIGRYQNTKKIDYKYFMYGLFDTVLLKESLEKLDPEVIIIEIGPAGILKKYISETNPKLNYYASQRYKCSFEIGVQLLKKNLWIDYGIHGKDKILKKGAMGILREDLIKNKVKKYKVKDPKLWIPKHVNTIKTEDYEIKTESIMGHQIGGKIIVPASAYIVAIWEKYEELNRLEDSIIKITDFKLFRPILIDQYNEVIKIKLYINPEGNFTIMGINEEILTSGKIEESKNFHHKEILPQESNGVYINNQEFYNIQKTRGYQYKNEYKSVDWINYPYGNIKFYNWVSYLDCMIQCLVHTEYNEQWGIKFPIKINQLELNNKKNFHESCFICKHSLNNGQGSYIRSKYAKIKDIEVSSEIKEDIKSKEIFQKYIHCPYGKYEYNDEDINNYIKLFKKYLEIRLTEEDNQLEKENIKKLVKKELDKSNNILLRLIDSFSINDYKKNPASIVYKFKEHVKLYQEDKYLGINYSKPDFDMKNVFGNLIQIIMENIFSYKFLEIGINHGELSSMILEYLNEYIGINYQYKGFEGINKDLLSNYKLNYPSVNIENNIEECLENRDLDCIIINNYLHKIYDLKKMLHKIFSSLKNGSYLLVRETFNNINGFINRNINNEQLTYELLVNIFQEVGFEIIIEYNLYSGNYGIYLLLKPENKTIKIIKIDEKSLINLKDTLLNEPNRICLEITENLTGIEGFVKSINKEYGEKKLIYMNNEEIFNSNMTVNYTKNGKNGFFARETFRITAVEEEKNYCIGINDNENSISRKLIWVENKPMPLGNLKIETYYTALNFKDVLLYSNKINKNQIHGWSKNSNLGFEFVGILENKERVMGFALNALSNQVYTQKELIWKIPNNWNYEDGATVCTAYITAYYSLFMRANLEEDDKILIHCGTGAVGIAAITLAIWKNCEIFVTCSSQQKKEFLIKKFPSLKKHHIGNSRNNEFVNMIMENTNYKGVDIVLNSLSGELLTDSLNCVAENGNFVEIGKYDIVNNKLYGLKNLANNISLHVIDLNTIINSKKIWGKLYKKFDEMLDNGIINPIPYKEFSILNIEDAFKYLSSGTHIGKVIVKSKIDKMEKTKIQHVNKFYPDSDVTYIVHGGLGGIGLILIRWFADKGIKNLIITTRKGIVTGEQKYRLEYLTELGISYEIFIGDIGINEEFEKFKQIIGKMKIGGIFCLSMIINDKLFKDMNKEEWEITVKSKIEGINKLDKWSREYEKNLKYFVVWSSISSTFGNRGQSNYAYGNSYSNNIINERNEKGYSGISIEWGPINDAGYLARSENHYFPDLTYIPIKKSLLIIEKLLTNSCKGVYVYYLKSKKTIINEKQSLFEIVLELLNIDEYENIMDKKLFELGVDSLMTANIQNVFNNRNIYITSNYISELTLREIKNMNKTT